MKIVDVINVVKSGISQLTAANYFSAETPELTETDTVALEELGHALEDHQLAADIYLNSFRIFFIRFIISLLKIPINTPVINPVIAKIEK